MEINVKLLIMPFFLGVVSSYALEYVHLRMPALSLHGGFRYQSDVSLFVQKTSNLVLQVSLRDAFPFQNR